MTTTAPHPRLAAVELPNSGGQLLAAQQIVDGLPQYDLSLGDGLAILAVALNTLGVLDLMEAS